MVGRAMVLTGCSCLLLLAACGATCATSGSTPGGSPAPSASAWPNPSDPWAGSAGQGWPAGPPAVELAATGIELVNTTGIDAMVVDGAGSVWVAGGWQLSRVDPATGAAQTWTVADDAAFASVSAIRPSGRAGVWLVEDDRLRLFDGQRFVRDLPVPAQVRGGDHAAINDVAEVGTELWISSAAGVARTTREGEWSMVGQGSIWQAGNLAVDAGGTVWTVGRVAPGGDSRHVLVRLDHGRWSPLPGIAAPRFAEEVAADPLGGVLIRLGPAVRHFDGAQWRSIPALPALAFPRRGDTVAMAPDGAVWVAGADGLHRYAVPGGWTRFVAPEGGPLIGLDMRGAEVLAADSSGLLLPDAGRLRRTWSAPTQGLGAPVDGVLAVDSDEIWAAGDDAVLQFHDGRWTQRRPGLGWQGTSWTQRGAGTRLALAADGAVWAITDGGLARFARQQEVLIERPHPDGWLQPGPDSGMWAVEAIWSGWTTWYAGEDPDGSTVSLVRPDGTQMSVPLPGPAWSLTSLVAGTDGSIWATICQRAGFDYCTVPALMRWDGQWSHVPYPGTGIAGVSAAPEGGLWALLTTGESAGGERILARYAAGAWTPFPGLPPLQGLAAAPRGGVCGIDAAQPSLVCLDARGGMSSAPVGATGELRIGPDSSLWIERDGVVARLPGTVPAALPGHAP